MKYEVRWIEKTEYSVIIEADGYKQAKEEVVEGNFNGERVVDRPELDLESIEAYILEGE